MNTKVFSALIALIVIGSISYLIIFDKNTKQSQNTNVSTPISTTSDDDDRASAMLSDSYVKESEVTKIVDSYIKQNPEVIMKSIEDHYANQEKKSKELQKEKLGLMKDQVYNTASDPIIGNPKGQFKLVEFFDYNCGYCSKMLPVIHQLVAEYPDLQVILKEAPMLGDKSILASKASLSVNMIDSSKYSAFYSAMFAASDKSEANIMKIASDIGINAQKLKDTMQKPEIENMIQNNLKLASDLQIRGIPALILSDNVFSAVGFDTLKTALESMGAKRVPSKK